MSKSFVGLVFAALWVGCVSPVFSQIAVDAEALAGAVDGQNQEVVRLLEQRAVTDFTALGESDPLLVTLKQRAELLERLVGANPAEALSQRLPEDVSRTLQLHAEFRPFVERLGVWKAPVEVLVEDRFDEGTSRTLVNLLTDDGRRAAFFPSGVPELECQQHLTVEGMGIGESIAVTNAVPGAKGASGCSVFGEQKIAVILTEFSGKSLPSFATPSHFEDVLFSQTQYSLRQFWEENSDGVTWATGDVFGPYSINPNPACSTNQILDKAIDAADSSVNFSDYTRVFVIIPEDACGFLGLGSIGCTSLNTDDGNVNTSVTWISIGDNDSHASYMVAMGSHEGGHNMGLRHANSLEFGNTPLGGLTASGTRCEYGGIYSVMGILYQFPAFALTGHYTAFHKAQLGWFPPGEGFLQVESEGLYLIRPVLDPTGLRGLRFRRGAGNNRWMWIEYRQFEGDYDITLEARSRSLDDGALIHYEDAAGTEPLEPRLLDFQPGVPYTQLDGQCTNNGSLGSSDFFDVTLLPSSTWSDPHTNAWIRVDDANEDRVMVSLGYGSETCTYALADDTLDVGSSAGSDSGSVLAGSGCGWNAISNDPWLHVSAPSYDSGNGSLAFSFDANLGATERIGTISVADQTLTVTQASAQEPDLIVTALSASSAGTTGGTVTVSATVENDGDASAGAFDLAFYFSSNGVLDAGDARSATTCYYGGLGTGAANSGTCNSVEVALPGSLTEGSYTLIAKVDDFDTVVESNESNNTRVADTGTINVSVGACPAELIVGEQTLSGVQTLQATSSATLGPNLVVEGASITIRAPNISLQPGTTIGGSFNLSTTPSCQ